MIEQTITKPARRRKKPTPKQAEQLAALDDVHTTTWATAILLAACNVVYDMLKAEGRSEAEATAFARRMAEQTGQKLGEVIAGAPHG